MAKKIKAVVKLQVQAGKATPAPPIGTALGPHGINIGEFAQKFNAATKSMGDDIIPAIVTVYDDRSYSFTLKQPPASRLILKAIGLEKGSGKQKDKVGKISKAQLREIVKRKMEDMNTDDPEAAMRTLAGTAKNMGIEVVE